MTVWTWIALGVIAWLAFNVAFVAVWAAAMRHGKTITRRVL